MERKVKYPIFGANLRLLRDSVGLTQSVLAEKLGTNRGTYAGWEDGTSRPKPNYEKAIVEFFGITLDTMYNAVLPVDKSGKLIKFSTEPVTSVTEQAQQYSAQGSYSRQTHDRHVAEKDRQDFIYLPVIEIGAQGGPGGDVTDLEDRMVELRKVPKSMFDDAEAILPVYGNSMSPAYPPGSEVAIARDLSGFFEYGDVYVIKIKNKARPLLKRVEECDEDNCILLVSDNEMRRESGPLAGKFFYPPQKLQKELIDEVWEVIGDCKRRKNKAIQLRHFREESFSRKQTPNK